MDIKNFQLSPHFSYFEMTSTKNSDLLAMNREAGLAYKNAMAGLCRDILEPIRVYYGRPVIVSSGFRCPALNSLVGGSDFSQHQKGEAADIIISGVPCGLVFESFEEAFPTIEFGQFIWEKNNGKEWLHISSPSPLLSRNMQMLTIINGVRRVLS